MPLFIYENRGRFFVVLQLVVLSFHRLNSNMDQLYKIHNLIHFVYTSFNINNNNRLNITERFVQIFILILYLIFILDIIFFSSSKCYPMSCEAGVPTDR